MEPTDITAIPAPARPVALVTGGGVRIGRAISLAMAGAGYDIAVHARLAKPAVEATLAEIRGLGARAALVTGDLAEMTAVEALIPEATAALGAPSLLVNNASEFHPDALGSLEPGIWERHMACNLRAPVFLTQAFAAALPEGVAGAVVNIIDQRVWKPTPAYLSYAIAKNGLWAATRMLAQALAPRIRVNAVGPGPTLANDRQDGEAFAYQSRAVLLGRGPTPEEIAGAVLYLARAASITGQMIAVDGGQHLAWQTPDTETD
ncbi:SDR family oxidoreductase [Ancylobacter radicis]|uniref:SDR family oxidoreductase n=1 Tax=Ancylobacter radicis TaxID=2836179 RepID=A0ABS5RCN0_9HYPH|nr:SDR family oxidoreductase [Ancylobacter radicis]MBS9478604.1 SDR family oxidoreductase [Ancylobacter radicis]